MVIGISIGVCFQQFTSLDVILTDGDCTWRLEARDGELCWDHTLTPTGFSGTEDIDWYNAQSE